jgi:signal transduction histidine kinase
MSPHNTFTPSLSTACHELRNPLHAILALLEFLVEGSGLSRQQRKDVASIQVCSSVVVGSARKLTRHSFLWRAVRLCLIQLACVCPVVTGVTHRRQSCAFNMQRLVNDVLDLAKLREGKLALRPAPVSPLARLSCNPAVLQTFCACASRDRPNPSPSSLGICNRLTSWSW